MFSRKRKSVKSMKLAVACYSRDQWQQLLATADDSKELESTWEEWRENADKLIGRLKSGGADITEVLIDVNDLNEYCQIHNLPNNAETRSEYVTRILGSEIYGEEF
jgi:hypothetical protein